MHHTEMVIYPNCQTHTWCIISCDSCGTFVDISDNMQQNGKDVKIGQKITKIVSDTGCIMWRLWPSKTGHCVTRVIFRKIDVGQSCLISRNQFF